MNRNNIFKLMLCCIAVTSCTNAGDEKTLPTFSWTLPKTTFDIEADLLYLSCSISKEKNAPVVNSKATITLNAHGIPDLAIGAKSINPFDFQSFWQDHTIEVQVAPTTELLTKISSDATDQTGQIIGNILTTATKSATLALGGGTAEGAVLPGCGSADNKVKTIAIYTKELASLSSTSSKAKDLADKISNLQAQITIKLRATIDPGVSPLLVDQSTTSPLPAEDQAYKVGDIDASGIVAQVYPSLKQLQDAGWYNEAALQTYSPNFAAQSGVDVFLAFNHASGAAASQADKTFKATTLPSDDLFRAPAYIPVIVRSGQEPSPPGTPPAPMLFSTVLPFAQFGTARHIPFLAPTFGKGSWAITFNNFGELIDSTFGASAQGVGATGILANAASAAGTIGAQAAKNSAALPTNVQTIQEQNNIMDTFIKNQSDKSQCTALAAKGTPCPDQ